MAVICFQLNARTRVKSMLYPEVSEQIIKGFYHVYNTLGYGFLEKVYENSLRNG